ncbi:Undecaprenyl-phosphate galactosephosphotransferase [hydrothermal vent metagenome]|uniref:Undecaprenyl-phosphate galactosephosphotransferase n=1 Tax=hydrothermal vent metagenome TaxID=652676 RepID=A0A3B1BFV8_9ZZZZ
MLKKHNQIFFAAMLIVDVLAIILSWFLSYHVRFHSGMFDVPKGVPPFSEYATVLPVIIVIWIMALQMGGLYEPMRSNSRFHEYFRIFRTATISAVLMATAAFFYREFEFSRLMMGIFWGISIIALTFSHTVVRTALRNARKRGFNLRYVLIVGAGELGQTLAGTFARHPESGLKVFGILGDTEDDIGLTYHGYPVIGTIDQVKEKIQEHEIDQIFIALPRDADLRLEKTLALLGDETVDVKLAPDILQFMRLNSGVEDFDGIPIVSLTESPMYGWNLLLKRIFDIVVSLISIVIWAPVMLVVAILIKLESKGPLFYKQERMSLGGGSFVIYKFRSMKDEAESETGAVWAKNNDDRRTGIGEFLRRTSLDELPQLFNVLKGNMSLVGPRPERPVFVKDFKKTVPMYMLRHKMKAGITGWAQVNGWRGDTSLEKRIEFDLYYIENWSLFLDVKILWLTIWKGFINKHAY